MSFRSRLISVSVIVGVTFAVVPVANAVSQPKLVWSREQLFPLQKVKTSLLIRTPTRGQQSWSASGACRLSSGLVVAKAKGTCTLRVSVAKSGRFGAVTSTRKFRIGPYRLFAPTKDPAAGLPRSSTLRFDFSGAVGLARSSSLVRSQVSRPRSAPAPGSDLLVVLDSGATRPALATGQASVSEFLVAPNGKVYVKFTTSTNLGHTSCYLAQVYVDTGEVVCIESELVPVWSQVGGAAIQFDAQGNIYYFVRQGTIGAQFPTTPVLRRYADGAARNISNEYQNIQQWLVMQNGDVVVSGFTNPVGQAWTRRITSGGRITTIANTMANWIRYFPDGDVYIGVVSDKPGSDIAPGKTLYAKKIWAATGEVTGYDIGEGGGIMPSAFAKWIYSSTGEVFVFNVNKLVRMFPTFSANVSSLSYVTSASISGDELILAGTGRDGVNRLVRLNLMTRTEQVLLDGSDEIEIYNLRWSQARERIYFDGLRFSDNKYLIGYIDTSTGTVSAQESIIRLGAFETFIG